MIKGVKKLGLDENVATDWIGARVAKSNSHHPSFKNGKGNDDNITLPK